MSQIDRRALIMGSAAMTTVVMAGLEKAEAVAAGVDKANTPALAVGNLRDDLIAAGKMLYRDGQGDYVLGHITVRSDEEPGHILMKPFSMGLEEMTRENLTVVDIEGRKVGGPLPRHGEVFIHTEIMRARPEINAVVHTHAPHAVIFSSLGKKILPVGHEGSLFVDALPVFDETTDLIVTQERGRAVAKRMGGERALLLRNHGIATCGASIQEAVFLALALERACWMQLMAEAAGGPKLVSNPEDVKAKKPHMLNTVSFNNEFEYLRRKIGSP